jgi:F-type H+-transporting ATPase subunit gamma
MDQNYNITKRRLDNINSIQPLLTALRTISLANWKSALNRFEHLNSYISSLEEILFQIPVQPIHKHPEINLCPILIILGSSRGFCGDFNRNILKQAKVFLSKDQSKSDHKIILFGSRIRKLFDLEELQYSDAIEIPKSGSLNYEFISKLLISINAVKNGKSFSIIYNQYQRAGKYKTDIHQIFPYQSESNIRNNRITRNFIFDTDPIELANSLKVELFSVLLYKAFLSSAAAEHSMRFLSMENASRNADRIVKELEIKVQIQRRQKITNEMQELAVGAGLLTK